MATAVADRAKNEAAIRDYIDLPVRVQISDGRVMVGKFVCCDNDLNIVMTGSQEVPVGEKGKSCLLGLILIPGKHVVKVEVFKESVEKYMVKSQPGQEIIVTRDVTDDEDETKPL
mmetsp:Transcript_8800/g.13139  ORF Transcript_8800/g.13139 Transcript_8800/m.13139 type:complete len:115 (+) Transcript_8800:25-369(+)